MSRFSETSSNISKFKETLSFGVWMCGRNRILSLSKTIKSCTEFFGDPYMGWAKFVEKWKTLFLHSRQGLVFLRKPSLTMTYQTTLSPPCMCKYYTYFLTATEFSGTSCFKE